METSFVIQPLFFEFFIRAMVKLQRTLARSYYLVTLLFGVTSCSKEAAVGDSSQEESQASMGKEIKEHERP